MVAPEKDRDAKEKGKRKGREIINLWIPEDKTDERLQLSQNSLPLRDG